MNTARKMTLVERAAEYFGWDGEPHDAIKVGDRRCIMVRGTIQRGRTVLVSYEEYGVVPTITALHFTLTPRQRERLLAALADPKDSR